jgi:hypothetical protein
MSRFHQREVPGRVLTEFTNADALHPEMVALGVLHVWESFRSRAVQHRVVGSFLTLTVSAPVVGPQTGSQLVDQAL